MKLGAVESTTYLAPILCRMSACSLLRTMLTRPMPSLMQILLSIWPRLEAAAVCTSALWPSRRMVSVMPSAVSGLTKQDAPSAAVVPAGSGSTSAHLDGAILRIHRAADHRDGLAHQRLGGIRRSGLDHDAGAFVADRHRFIEPRRHRPHRRFRHFCGDHGLVLGARNLGGRHVGRADQQPEVGRIDRRGLDADHDFIFGRLRRRNAGQRNLEFAALLEQRAQLQPGLAVTHTYFLPAGGSASCCRSALCSSGTISDMVAVGNDVQLYRRFQSSPPASRRSSQRAQHQPDSSGALHAGNGSQNRSKPVLSALSRPHLAPKHQRRRILGCATWLDWGLWRQGS